MFTNKVALKVDHTKLKSNWVDIIGYDAGTCISNRL